MHLPFVFVLFLLHLIYISVYLGKIGKILYTFAYIHPPLHAGSSDVKSDEAVDGNAVIMFTFYFVK